MISVSLDIICSVAFYAWTIIHTFDEDRIWATIRNMKFEIWRQISLEDTIEDTIYNRYNRLYCIQDTIEDTLENTF